jgi:hypothetical protein
MLTHLRTGRDIVARGAIPTADPYSFTAMGERWVVQSWLPDWLYGMAHRMGGYRLVVFEQALLTGLLAWLIVKLAQAGSPLRTALAGLIAIGVGAAVWSPRPRLIGLICMALTIAVVERRRSRWLLLPILWIWVNSHGSFPLGLLWLAARAAGEWLDWRAWPREALRYVTAFAAGLAVSILNPLGARLLAFPFTIAQKREAFLTIVEWKSPDFHRAGGVFALVFLAIALAVLFRARNGWRDVVPAVVFLAASLYSVRNLAVAAIVLAPALGRAVRRPEVGSPDRPSGAALPASRLRTNRVFMVTIALVFVVFTASIFTAPGLELDAYPTDAVTFLAGDGLLTEPHRMAHQDFVGNYLILRYGAQARVFIDDRYDMYPLTVSRAYKQLQKGGTEALEVLERYDIDVVLWDRTQPLIGLLQARPDWREAFRKAEWVVMRRVT